MNELVQCSYMLILQAAEIITTAKINWQHRTETWSSQVWSTLSTFFFFFFFASQVVLAVKNLSANAGYIRDMGLIPGSGRVPGGGHGNPLLPTLAWRIPWTEEPGGLQSIGSKRIRHKWSSLTQTLFFPSFLNLEMNFPLWFKKSLICLWA